MQPFNHQSFFINQPLTRKNVSGLKVCVLQPDYSTTGVDYKNYDPPRDLSSLLPEATVDHVFLNKLTTYKQLKTLSKKNYDIYVNLCEGYLEWEVPSIEVIYFLELLELPFTGPSSKLYDPTKELMKYVAYTQGVSTPAFALVEDLKNVEKNCSELKYPLFVKPSKAGDSLGIDQFSKVENIQALLKKCAEIIEEYGPLLVEEYIEGREFTVMVSANADDSQSVTCYDPVEYIFPDKNKFKTYALKTSELHPNANVPVKETAIADLLKDAAAKIFAGFGGVGYARLDFRMDAHGQLFFLEINFTCSVFYTNGYEGSADYILKLSNVKAEDFLRRIIAEGIFRHHIKQKAYTIKGNAISGYGIYANRDIQANDLVFKGEGRAQRIATHSYIHKNWSVKEIENFKKYAYPVCNEVFLLWDENPAEWAPQNHSCEPNTAYQGLDVYAVRFIKKGEELTLQYADFLDENMDPFHCSCGSKNCRGYITGTPGNSVSFREKNNSI